MPCRKEARIYSVWVWKMNAGRDVRIRLAKPNSQARTGTGENTFFLFRWPKVGLATIQVDAQPAEPDDTVIHTYIHV